MHKEADIAFVICYPFQFHVMKDVYALLKDRAEFVVDLGAYYPAKQPPELEDDLVRILKGAGARYRILRHEDYFHAAVLEKFFARYKGVVALWERGAVRLACNASKPKIQLTYGAGKELNMVRPSRGIFDCILSYGERDHALASLYTRSVIVGNPRFDPWFRGEISKKDVAAVAAKLDRSKKTVLYLPTHSDLSSIDELGDEIAKLTHSWNVIAKLHYFTPREEPERVRRMRESGAVVCGDDVDLVRLLTLPDVVLSDNSSAIFDAILADKPVLATDFLDATYLDETHKEPRAYRRGAQPALTYSGSIEQVIKKDGRVPTITEPSELAVGLERALALDAEFKVARKKIRSELFSFNDGVCAARAVREIEATLAHPLDQSRPILFHAIEAYRRSINIMSYTRGRRLEQKVNEYERTVQESTSIDFAPACILFRDDSVAASIEIAAIRAACEQELPYVDIVIFSLGHKNTLSIPQDLKEHVREVSSDGGVFASTIDGCISQLKGTHVFFGTTACSQPPGWTLRHKAAYLRYGSVGGVGGYVQPYERVDKSSSSLMSQFLAARALNIFEARYLPKMYEVVNRLYAANPTGDLRAVSYDRRYIGDIHSQVCSLPHLEEFLKISVLQKASLCFLPAPIRSHAGNIWDLRGEMYRGEMRAMVHTRLIGLGGTRSPLISIPRETILAARMHRSVAFARAVFYLHVAQLAGYIRYQIYRLKRIGEGRQDTTC